MKGRLYPLTEKQFETEVLPHLLSYKDGRGRPAKISDYSFFCGVLYVLRTGIPWRDLPQCYGSWHTIYTRFKRWSESGWFWRLLNTLQAKKAINIDFAWVDSTSLGVHRHGSGALKKKGSNQLAEGVRG